MKKNVGGIDKGIRIVIGTVLLLAGLFVQMATGWRVVVFAVAAIAYITAFTGLWPLWAVLGISTHKKEQEETGQKHEAKSGEKPETGHEERGKPHGGE